MNDVIQFPNISIFVQYYFVLIFVHFPTFSMDQYTVENDKKFPTCPGRYEPPKKNAILISSDRKTRLNSQNKNVSTAKEMRNK